MRAVLVLAVLLVWTTFVLGSVAMVAYLVVDAFTPARIATDTAATGAPMTRSRAQIRLGQALAFCAIFGLVYGIVVGAGFVGQGDIGNFVFAAAPALVFAALAAVTSLRLRSP